MATTITVTGTVGPLAGGETKSVAGSLTNAATVGQLVDAILASGDTTFAVPAGAVGVLVTPPVGNVIALKLKGSGGDVGIVLHATNPTLLSLAPAQTTLVLNAAALLLGALELNWF